MFSRMINMFSLKFISEDLKMYKKKLISCISKVNFDRNYQM